VSGASFLSVFSFDLISGMGGFGDILVFMRVLVFFLVSFACENFFYEECFFFSSLGGGRYCASHEVKVQSE